MVIQEPQASVSLSLLPHPNSQDPASAVNGAKLEISAGEMGPGHVGHFIHKLPAALNHEGFSSVATDQATRKSCVPLPWLKQPGFL
jgi:hypothetical protein